MSITLTGVGNTEGGAALAPGYRWRSGAGAADFPNPTGSNFPLITTKLDDVGLNDHTTYEEILRPAELEVNFIQFLYIHTEVATLASATGSLFFGAGVTLYEHYWDGAAWQTLTGGIAWPPQFSSAWVDHTRNFTDRSTQFLLLTLECTGDGADMDSTKGGDWRITPA